MNRKINKNIGYVSIELVITAALILAVGFFAMMNFGVLGLDTMSRGMSKLDGTGVFASGETTAPSTGAYDSNGYDKSLNVKTTDINPVSDFEFIDLGDSYSLINYLNTTDLDVVIPKIYNGKLVVEIADSAFDYDGLYSVAIPNSVKRIGNKAFNSYSHSLTSVIIPDSVTSIGDLAFFYNGLTSIKIPNSVITIGASAFHSNFIESIEIPNSVTTIGDSAFMSNKISSLKLSDNMTVIQNQLFSNNKLTSVTIPNGIKTIGMYAFDVNQISLLEISSSVETIDSYAFRNNSLVSLVIPANVALLKNGAFTNNLLTSVEFLGNSPIIKYAQRKPFVGNVGLGLNSIKVPIGKLAAYKALYNEYGVIVGAFYE